MSFFKKSRQFVAAILLFLVITTATACATVSSQERTNQLPSVGSSQLYTQLERGNTGAGQKFGDWVVQTAQGMIQDAYVRDNNKLGVVITRQVKPNEVRPLARSLVQGFHQNFSNQDLTVLMYAPDKQLILTAQYDQQTKQIQYQ